MSIATELTLLANSKQAIKASINAKGGSVTDSTPFADYSTAIDNLPSGGSGNPVLTSIEVSDFSGTTFNRTANYITDVTIPSGVTELGYEAFYQCVRLTSITLPNTLNRINQRAFMGCSSLQTINIPNTVTTIYENAFAESGLTSFSMPMGITNSSNIGNGLLSNCKNLTSVDFGNINEIRSFMCYGCTSLTAITIPSTVTSIAGSAFKGCTALTSVTIPDSVTTIDVTVFEGCTALTSVTIGNGVTRIGAGTFISCTALASVTINTTTPPTIAANTFNNTNNCPIYVPAESVDAYKAASGWSTYADRIQAIPEDVKPAFKFTSSVDSSKDVTVNCEDTATAGTLATNDLGMSSQQIDEFRSAENTGSVEIGDCVKIYRASNCYTAKGISEVILNEGLERIEDFAFGGMSALREITIPSTVTNISYQAFYADRALQGITCLATTPPTLGSDVFGDTNNVTIYVPGESVDTYKTAWPQYADRIEPI